MAESKPQREQTTPAAPDFTRSDTPPPDTSPTGSDTSGDPYRIGLEGVLGSAGSRERSRRINDE